MGKSYKLKVVAKPPKKRKSAWDKLNAYEKEKYEIMDPERIKYLKRSY